MTVLCHSKKPYSLVKPPICAIMIAFALVLSFGTALVANVDQAQAKSWGSLEYKIDYDAHTVKITKCNDTEAYVTVPKQIEGCDVVSIQYGAFRMLSNLKQVTIEANISEIDGVMFYKCTNLERIVLPDTVESIGEVAFYGCTNLKDAMLGNGVRKIGEKAFYGCTSLTSINLPSALTAMEKGAFMGCTALGSIALPEGVVALPESAFDNCKALSSVTLCSGFESIGKRAFSNCDSLKTLDLPGSVTEIGAEAFRYSGIESIALPNGLKTIGDSAFSYSKLSQCDRIPGSVTSIGNYAFSNCKFTHISVGEGIKTLPKGMFFACMALESVGLPYSLESIGENAFMSCKALRYLRVPSGVNSVGAHAFEDMPEARSIYFENPNVNLHTNTPNNSAFGGTASEWKNLTIVGPKDAANPTCKAEASAHGIAFKTIEETGYTTVMYGAGAGGTGSMAATSVLVPNVPDPNVTDKTVSYFAAPECTFTNPNGTFRAWRMNGRTYQAGEAVQVEYYPYTTQYLVASWDAGWTLSFAPGTGGVGETFYVPVKKEAVYELPANPFEAREGYAFRGWKMPSYFWGGATLSAGAEIIPSANLPIKADWTGSYKVTFDARGGTATPSTMSTGPDGTLGDWPVITRPGYALEGLYVDDALTIPLSRARVFTSDTTVYALWEEALYTVWFDPDGGTLAAGAEKATTNQGGTLASLPTPTRSGYNFAGWYTASDEKVEDGHVFSSDTNLIAHWNLAVSHKVTFDPAGGTLLPGEETASTNVLGMLASLPTPTRSGFTFLGWYTSDNVLVKANHVFTGDTKLTAQWKAAPTPSPSTKKKMEVFAGATRYETAQMVVEAACEPAGTPYAGVIVVSGREGRFPDALSAAGLCGIMNYPLLVVDGVSLNNANKAALNALKKANGNKSLNIIIVGGTATVSSGVEKSLKSWGSIAKRVAGADRYATNSEVFKFGATQYGGWTSAYAFIATGATFPDALSIAPYLSASRSPILLAKPGATSLTSAQKSIVSPAKSVVALGGTGAVSDKFLNAAKSASAGKKSERLGGSDRYETSAKIAKWEIDRGMTIEGAGIATGVDFPDALGSGFLLGKGKSILCLASPKSSYNKTMADVLKTVVKTAGSPQKIRVFGGTSAVPSAIREQMASALGWTKGSYDIVSRKAGVVSATATAEAASTGLMAAQI